MGSFQGPNIKQAGASNTLAGHYRSWKNTWNLNKLFPKKFKASFLVSYIIYVTEIIVTI